MPEKMLRLVHNVQASDCFSAVRIPPGVNVMITIFGGKGTLLETNVIIHFLHKLVVFSLNTAIFWRNYFYNLKFGPRIKTVS
jgi:hypothetical protein